MARTLPEASALSSRDRELLRAIYYRQQLPHDLLALGVTALSSRLQVLEMAGYVKKTSEQIMLTDAGQLALLRMYGGRKPPMIDTLTEAQLDPKDRRSQYVVGGSLASKLAREVSGGA